jgi:hypothetical protein
MRGISYQLDFKSFTNANKFQPKITTANLRNKQEITKNTL